MAAGYSAAGDPPPIVYTADIFDDEALDLAVESGIHVNCGSPDMIDQLGRRAPGREITLRINPGFGHGHSQKTNTGGDQSKHGIWHEQLAEMPSRWPLGTACTITGLHMHIGSGTDLEHLSQVCGAMERCARQIGPSITTISAGGGLPIAYRPGEQLVDLDAYFRLWDATRKRLAEAFGHPVRLEIEPGRYLVAESGYLVSQIRAVKQTGRERSTFWTPASTIWPGRSSTALTIRCRLPADDGIARNVRSRTWSSAARSANRATSSRKRKGASSARGRCRVARVGELLVIERAGAYGFVMGSNYNSKPLAAEVLIVDKNPIWSAAGKRSKT